MDFSQFFTPTTPSPTPSGVVIPSEEILAGRVVRVRPDLPSVHDMAELGGHLSPDQMPHQFRDMSWGQLVTTAGAVADSDGKSEGFIRRARLRHCQVVFRDGRLMLEIGTANGNQRDPVQVVIREHAFGQLCKALKMPARFALRIPGADMVPVINGLLSRHEQSRRYQLRCVTPPGQLPELRSIQSHAYGEFSTVDALGAAESGLRSIGVDLDRVTASATFGTCDSIRLSWGEGSIGPDGMRLDYGLRITNGELGNASYRVRWDAWRRFCDNGMGCLLPVAKTRGVHRGQNLRYQARAAIREAAANFGDNRLAFQAAGEVAHGFIATLADFDKMLADSKRMGVKLDANTREAVISEARADRAAVRAGLASRQDLPSEVVTASDSAHAALAEFSAWEMLQGITGVARDRGAEDGSALDTAAPAFLRSIAQA